MANLLVRIESSRFLSLKQPILPKSISSRLSGLFVNAIKITVVIWLGSLLLIKLNRLWSSVNPNDEIKLYGIGIGLVLFASFLGAFFFYRDPYVIGLKNP